MMLEVAFDVIHGQCSGGAFYYRYIMNNFSQHSMSKVLLSAIMNPILFQNCRGNILFRKGQQFLYILIIAEPAQVNLALTPSLFKIIGRVPQMFQWSGVAEQLSFEVNNYVCGTLIGVTKTFVVVALNYNINTSWNSIS